MLLVGHAATLDCCTRQQTGHQPRSAAELRSFLGERSNAGLRGYRISIVLSLPTHLSPSLSGESLFFRAVAELRSFLGERSTDKYWAQRFNECYIPA